jgi:hypothetical protein
MSVHKKHENTEACPLTALKQWFFTGVFDVSVRQTWCPNKNLKEIKIPGWKSVIGHNFERGPLEW